MKKTNSLKQYILSYIVEGFIITEVVYNRKLSNIFNLSLSLKKITLCFKQSSKKRVKNIKLTDDKTLKKEKDYNSIFY